MPTEMKMPKLTQTMDEGKVLDWLKNEGDAVEKGEPILMVESDKANVELEAPTTGILARIVAKAGDVVEVGLPLAYLTAPGESTVSEAPSTPAEPPAPPSAPVEVSTIEVGPPSSVLSETAPSAGDGDRVFASPRARRVARELGVALDQVKGTGPGGRVVEDDVVAAAEAAKAAPAVVEVPPVALAETLEAAAVPAPALELAQLEATTAPAPLVEVAPQVNAALPEAEAEAVFVVPLTGMRKAIAERMSFSAQSTAAVTLTIEVDMTEAGALRQQVIAALEASGLRPTFTDMIVKATAKALAEFPHINARWSDSGIERVADINVGVAVALGERGEEGLVVPVIRNADRLSVTAISQRTRDIAEGARQRRLSQDEFAGGTFTITNLGTYDIDIFTPIINPPEGAILGVGRIAPKPAVVDGELVVRSLMTLSLTVDHRVIDGAAGAVFLRRVRDLLQSPLQLLL
jgi:pyruvate dehydrogenase E2 component (dihydrolipoamide acetyltransferase)